MPRAEKRGEGRKESPESTLPWEWQASGQGLSEKLAEIENTLGDFYDYGEADRHAGQIEPHMLRELDRMQRIAHYEDVIWKLNDAVEKKVYGMESYPEDETSIEDENAS